MLNWLIGTLFMAFPLLLPIFILMIARKIGYRWPAQRLFMRVALAFYAISLVLIGGHAAETGLGLQEFFNAYYGAASDATLLYYLTDEAREGGRAFLEKRRPDFSNSPSFP